MKGEYFLVIFNADRRDRNVLNHLLCLQATSCQANYSLKVLYDLHNTHSDIFYSKKLKELTLRCSQVESKGF